MVSSQFRKCGHEQLRLSFSALVQFASASQSSSLNLPASSQYLMEDGSLLFSLSGGSFVSCFDHFLKGSNFCISKKIVFLHVSIKKRAGSNRRRSNRRPQEDCALNPVGAAFELEPLNAPAFLE
jgi:hypothetical protein